MSRLLNVMSVSKSYKNGSKVVNVFDSISFEMDEGEFLAVSGVSGVGKSTLLNIIGLLDKPDAGDVELKGIRYSSLNENQKSDFRNKHLGFVFQFHHLLPEFSVLENIIMPSLIGGTNFDEAAAKAKELADIVDIGHRLDHFPSMLSGGEQQRVAVLRAMFNKPDLLLMDEPTGNLDPYTGRKVIEHIFQLRKVYNLSCIIVTHNMEIASRCDKIFSMDELELKDV